jgi:hypothetical protein
MNRGNSQLDREGMKSINTKYQRRKANTDRTKRIALCQKMCSEGETLT